MRGHNFLAIFGIIQAESGVINVNLNENLSVGSEVTRLRKVIDANVPFDADLEFRIVKQDRQNGLELFDIIGGDGVLKLKQVPDRETLCHRKMSCILRLQVVVLPPKYYQDLTIEVTIIDENDNLPKFHQKLIKLEIEENSRTAISLDQELAFDPDLGENGKIVYSLGNNEYFTLEQYKDQIGQHLDLIPVGTIDKEKTSSIDLTLNAFNPINPSELATVSIIIKVLDQNEHTPSFSKKEYKFTVNEIVESGSIVGKVDISDGDGQDSVTISIRDVDIRNYFRVTQSGQILTNKKLDFEKIQKFEFWIIGSDSVHSTLAHIIIQLIDANDNAPSLFITFTNPHESIVNAGWIDENAPSDQHVAYIGAEDADSRKNGQTSIRLINEKDIFQLDSGILKTLAALDREEIGQYNIEVQACDNGIEQQCTVRRVTVFVRDLNDNMPICKKDTFYASISESIQIGANVIQIEVSDSDSELFEKFGLLDYALEPAGVFTIDAKTGVVILAEELDYETKKSYDLVTLVKDGGGLETRCHLVVEVEDANEAAPVFQQPTEDDLELLVNADDPEGSYLMTVEAIDPDYNPENSNGEKIKFEITGKGIIRIDEKTGQIYLNVSAADVLDEEKTFRVIISASDTGTPILKSSLRITVAIRQGVISGLVQDRRSIKGGATLALIAILAALTALLVLILIAVVFICRHKKMPNRYTCGNITTGTHGGHSPSTSTTKQHNPDGVKIHDDVSILYDSILTPRSSIVPEKLNRIDFSGKFLQTTPLNLICARHRQEQMQNCRHSTSDSDHADSGKGESDQDVGHNNQMGPRCNRQCLRYGHSDACWLEDDDMSSKSSQHELNISSISLDNRTSNIIHSHNPSLHQNTETKKEIHSSGYISQEDGSARLRMMVQSTPIKNAPSSSSSTGEKSSTNSSLFVSNRPIGCVIDVRDCDRSFDLTVRDVTLTRSYPVSPRVNIV